MKKRENEARKIQDALQSNDIIAEIIKFSAIWEASLDRYLAIEFGGTTKRYDDFLEYVAPTMSFAQKIEALKKMSFHRTIKSHANIVSSLTRVRKIRNKVAHVYQISKPEMDKIQSDRELVSFILNFPESFHKEKIMLDNSFSHLWRSWEVRLKKERVYWAQYISKNPEGYRKFLPKSE